MPTEQQINERKWCWTGHTLCNPQGATERHALDGTFKVQGRGIAKKMEKRTREGELQKAGVKQKH